VVMPQIKDSKTLAAADAGKEDGRRPTIVSAPAAASPELLDRPRRRTPRRPSKPAVALRWGAQQRRNFFGVL
jgi:hypothetical protein